MVFKVELNSLHISSSRERTYELKIQRVKCSPSLFRKFPLKTNIYIWMKKPSSSRWHYNYCPTGALDEVVSMLISTRWCRNRIRMNGWVDTTGGLTWETIRGVTIIKMRTGKFPLYLFFSPSLAEMSKKNPKIATLTIACSCTSSHTKTEDWPIQR